MTPISYQVIDYAHAIHQLFEKTYFIEKLLIDLEASQASNAKVASSQKSNNKGFSEQDRVLLMKLARIAQFLQEVILNMVMADIRYMMQKYMMEMYK